MTLNQIKLLLPFVLANYLAIFEHCRNFEIVLVLSIFFATCTMCRMFCDCTLAENEFKYKRFASKALHAVVIYILESKPNMPISIKCNCVCGMKSKTITLAGFCQQQVVCCYVNDLCT